MNIDDTHYVQKCIDDRLVLGPVLELGGGYGGETCRELIARNNMDYYSTDLAAPKEPVDFIANFETGDGVDTLKAALQFNCIIVLNVLEHVFQPIRVLDTAADLLAPGGTLLVSTPAVWPIHNYPRDCSRILPDWYRCFAEHASMQIVETHFLYFGYGEVRSYCVDGLDHFPKTKKMTGFAGLRSRLIHRVFNTYGRDVQFRPHISIGAAFRKSN